MEVERKRDCARSRAARAAATRASQPEVIFALREAGPRGLEFACHLALPQLRELLPSPRAIPFADQNLRDFSFEFRPRVLILYRLGFAVGHDARVNFLASNPGGAHFENRTLPRAVGDRSGEDRDRNQ